MKKFILSFSAILLFAYTTFAQSVTGSGSATTPLTPWYEWNLGNVGTAPTERVIAYINFSSIGSFSGCSIAGQITDINGNWGYALPTVANFKAYLNFTNQTCALTQDVMTANIILELKSISTTQWALVANCPNNNTGVRLLFRVPELFTNGSLTLGNPLTVAPAMTMLIASPTYQSAVTGSLMVNTTSANASKYTLAVGGSAIAQSMIVQLQSNWPDYVFKPSYQLPTLQDVKTYINQNHHLPEIPSEQEIAKDGLDLGEMNKLLMKKVEELTLYAISSDKQNKDQAALLAEQKALLIKIQEKLKAQQKEINQLKK